MEEKLNEKFEESSLERIRKVAEELKKTGVRELKKGNPKQNEKVFGPGIGTVEQPIIQKEEIKIAEIEADLSDLIRERMELEKVLQEINNLKSKICQRIGLIKTIERREKELNQQLASVRKENDFSDQIKKRFENLKGNIK